MKLTSEEARNILEEARKHTEDDRWIDHCICVGNTAGRIAQVLYEKGINIDVDKTIALGYIHDIGKKYINNEYSLEEKIINLCDLMFTTNTLTVEKRMIDLLLRHGVFA